ncbi:YhcH/YjgK/YiaL family protein [Porphyromonas pogonae]|uniref:YhcH/YjgK/YiaL family protein n=1 Tax=Porphyromonas pogonae TaxID=867595 RepID=UPI002E798327|nr:YhcH/YjgK/YiaL family protein [Porphyromonas pogonae]
MIVASLRDSARYESLHPLFKDAFEYIKNNDLLHHELGRIEIKGNDLFINNVNPDSMKQEDQLMEVHEDYLDIHILLEGKERIGWKPTFNCTKPKGEFDHENDYILYYDEPSAYVDLCPGQFAIVYPEDAHAPLIGQGKIRKLIVKVKL